MKIPFKTSVNWTILLFTLFSMASNLNAQSSEGVYSTSLEPLKNAVYKFVFTPGVDIPADAEIDIVFPPQINLTRVTHAGSNTLSGGYVTIVNADTVKVKRENGSRIFPQGSLCDFMVSPVVNPIDFSREFSFTILIKDDETITKATILSRIKQIP